MLVETGVKGLGSAVLLRRFVFLTKLEEIYPGRKSLFSSFMGTLSPFLEVGF